MVRSVKARPGSICCEMRRKRMCCDLSAIPRSPTRAASIDRPARLRSTMKRPRERGHLEVLVGSKACLDRGSVTVTAQDHPDGLVRAEVNASRSGFVFLSEPVLRAAGLRRWRSGDAQGEPRLRGGAGAGRPPRVELRYAPTSFYRAPASVA